MNKRDKSQGLRQLRKSAADMDEFVHSAADLGLIVSMGEGRRLWHQLEPKPVEKKEITDTIKEEFAVTPPAWKVAQRLIEAGVSQEEVLDACKGTTIPDPDSNAIVNAMRNIELGLKPPRQNR